MQTVPKPSFFIKPSFLDKDSTGGSDLVSFGAFVIVVLLSIAFIWYDTANPPQSNKAGVNHGEVDHSEDGQVQNRQLKGVLPETPNDSVAAAGPTPLLKPRRFVSSAATGLTWIIQLNATLSPDNTMWRYTQDGWHDISMMANPPPVNKSGLQGIHPAIWTAMLLLSSLLLLIMASNDADIKKLLSRSSNEKKKQL